MGFHILAGQLLSNFVGMDSLRYWQKVKNLFGSSLLAYWPLWDASGNTAADISGNSRNASLTAVTLGGAGVGDGRTSAAFNGTTSYMNPYSVSLRDAFNGQEFSLLLWAKMSDIALWGDGVAHYLIQSYVSDNDNFYIRKSATNNQLAMRYCAGGTAIAILSTITPTANWFHAALTISKTANQGKGFFQGSQVDATKAIAGTWTGALAAGNTYIGASNGTPTFPWSGSIAHFLLLNRAATGTEVAKVQSFFSFSEPEYGFLALGDSKSAGNPWQNECRQTLFTTRNKAWHYTTYAVSGYKVADIRAGIDAQLAGITETETHVFSNLGANDATDAPTMADETTWKANYQYIIDACAAKWPGIKIYLMRPWRRNYGTECNTLAGWINALVAANPGVVFNGPDERVFLENGDNGATYTSDGTHPNAAGYTLTATQWAASIT